MEKWEVTEALEKGVTTTPSNRSSVLSYTPGIGLSQEQTVLITVEPTVIH